MAAHQHLREIAVAGLDGLDDALAGPYYAALREAHLDSVRALVDVSADGAPVRTIKVQVP